MSGKIKNAFGEIQAHEHLKMQTFENITAKKAKRTLPLTVKLAPAMAVFVMLILVNVYLTPVAFISIDINPSVELSLNTFDRVIDVTADNKDGAAIINSLNLKNLNYVDALELLDDTENFTEFTDSYTEITVISDNSTEIIHNIEGCGFNHQNVSFHSANVELKEQAFQNNISFGKYRAYLELLEVNQDIHVDEIAHLPMKVIREMIENDGVFDQAMLPPANSNGNGNSGSNSQHQGGGGGHQHGKTTE